MPPRIEKLLGRKFEEALIVLEGRCVPLGASGDGGSTGGGDVASGDPCTPPHDTLLLLPDRLVLCRICGRDAELVSLIPPPPPAVTVIEEEAGARWLEFTDEKRGRTYRFEPASGGELVHFLELLEQTALELVRVELAPPHAEPAGECGCAPESLEARPAPEEDLGPGFEITEEMLRGEGGGSRRTTASAPPRGRWRAVSILAAVLVAAGLLVLMTLKPLLLR